MWMFWETWGQLGGMLTRNLGLQRLGRGVGPVSCVLCLAWSQKPPLGEEDMEDMECSPEASKEPSKTCRWQGQ